MAVLQTHLYKAVGEGRKGLTAELCPAYKSWDLEAQRVHRIRVELNWTSWLAEASLILFPALPQLCPGYTGRHGLVRGRRGEGDTKAIHQRCWLNPGKGMLCSALTEVLSCPYLKTGSLHIKIPI